jgi:hypothetical protein
MKDFNTLFLSCSPDKIHTDNFHCFYKNIAIYDDWENKVVLGDEYVCRFCGENDRKKFKKDNAHSFPESTGNKWLISKDECKECNKKFGEYESELGNHGLLMRTLYGTKTKKGKPCKLKNKSISLQKGLDGYLMKLFTENKEYQHSNKNGKVEFQLDFTTNEQRANITLPGTPYIPLYLFKALSKIAFSIMPTSELTSSNFEKFKSWLIDIKAGLLDESYFPFHYLLHNRLSLKEREPLLALFKKADKYKDLNIPTYSFVFMYTGHVFQIFLPYYKKDEWILNGNELKLMIMPEIMLGPENNKTISAIDGTIKERIKGEDFSYVVKGQIKTK